MTIINQPERKEAVLKRLKLALGHLVVAEALGDRDNLPDIREVKSLICRVIRRWEPPLEGKR